MLLQDGQRMQDCDSCDQDDQVCFRRQSHAVLEIAGLPAISVDRNNWLEIIEVARSLPAGAKKPELTCLEDYNVCPLSIVDMFTETALETHFACGGLSRITSPAEYYDLPAAYVQVVNIISGEMSRIRRSIRGKK